MIKIGTKMKKKKMFGFRYANVIRITLMCAKCCEIAEAVVHCKIMLPTIKKYKTD